GGLMHLFMNMAVLWQLGSVLENARGWLYFSLLYFLGGILTSLFTLIYIYNFNTHSNVVGASGAICVLIGWIAKKDPFSRKGLIIAVLLISFAPLLMGVNVAWFAHILGFAVGYLIAKYVR
ncbi:MAG: rhomboid family intramembrane serine protease, partial [Campylobacteraceae bacterium]|nr:rhomboid family intramembrane serine protease [Campylobacteraceae bacterium]